MTVDVRTSSISTIYIMHGISLAEVRFGVVFTLQTPTRCDSHDSCCDGGVGVVAMAQQVIRPHDCRRGIVMIKLQKSRL